MCIICFILRYKKLGLLEQNSYKKRYFDGTRKLKRSFGDMGIFTYKNCRFETAHLSVMHRYFKRLLKRKYASHKIAWVWIFLKGNFPIRRKSKNSRMGKGIGSFVKWATRLPRGYSLAEFKGVSAHNLKKFKNRWQKHLNFPIVLY